MCDQSRKHVVFYLLIFCINTTSTCKSGVENVVVGQGGPGKQVRASEMATFSFHRSSTVLSIVIMMGIMACVFGFCSSFRRTQFGAALTRAREDTTYMRAAINDTMSQQQQQIPAQPYVPRLWEGTCSPPSPFYVHTDIQKLTLQHLLNTMLHNIYQLHRLNQCLHLCSLPNFRSFQLMKPIYVHACQLNLRKENVNSERNRRQAEG